MIVLNLLVIHINSQRLLSMASNRFDYDSDVEADGYDYVLTFGVHNGTTVGALAKTAKGRSALRYYLSWEKLKQPARDAIAFVLEEYERAKSTRHQLQDTHK